MQITTASYFTENINDDSELLFFLKGIFVGNFFFYFEKILYFKFYDTSIKNHNHLPSGSFK